MKSFHSPTKGKMSLEQVLDDLIGFVGDCPYKMYRVIIGTDSRGNQQKGAATEFVTAIVVHRVGHGGRYWWAKTKDRQYYSLPSRIYQEANLSVQTARHLLELLQKKLGRVYLTENDKPHIEIHTDIGRRGPTRELIKEVVGMIQGNGFEVRIKPEAYGAAIVADRHT